MSKQHPHRTTATDRRTVLGGLAGLGALSLFAGRATADSGDDRSSLTPDGVEAPYAAEGAETHHPGHPRFVHVGDRIVNPAWINLDVLGGRDNLAPRLTEYSEDPTEWDEDDFEWSVAQRPDGSTADIQFATPEPGDDLPERYDHGTDNVAEFIPDEPGRYVLELDAPDGTHQLTVHAFPEPPEDARAPPQDPGAPPRVELEAAYEEENEQFVVETNPQLSAESDAEPEELEVHALADDRDALSTDELQVDGDVITIDEAALDGELGRVHAVAYDGTLRSMLDTVELVTSDGDAAPAIAYPNRPPAWLENGAMYQIFPRSWAGERDAADFDVLADGDEERSAEGVEYLDDLGIDFVWLTPVVPAVSVERNDPPETFAGGGPHGYDTLDYFGIASDLVPEEKDPIEAYQDFVDACHEHDIKVLFDLVANHAGRDIDLFQETIAEQDDLDEEGGGDWPRIDEWDEESRFFDWWDRAQASLEADEDNPNYDEGTVIEPEPHVTGFFDLQVMPNFNFDNVQIREYLLAVVDFWSGEVGVDGMRCDIAWGVPHSFWKEAREVALRNNEEFIWLDETIPKEPEFAENEFDIHFDSDGDGFTERTHAVARGDVHGGELFDTIASRPADGFPDHSLVLNIIENHDEHRLLNQAVVDLTEPDHDDIPDEEWDEAARIQRLCWAAGVLLPGVPGVYYGQERQISRFGEGRHLGADDPRGFDDDGEIDPAADVRPGGRQRAFMNWEEYDEDHVEFYRDVLEFYHEHDVLKPRATLEPVWFRNEDDDELLLFGRDASEVQSLDRTGEPIADDPDPEQVIVVVNFEDEPSEVDLVPEASTEDLFTGEEIGIETAGEATSVEVEDFAVVETEAFGVQTELLAEWDDPVGDDHGPGTYTYPEADDFNPGAFDIVDFELYEGEDAHRFVIEVDDLQNPWGLDAGYSLQYVQVYVHDPEAPDEEASAFAAEGVNAAFERDCHRRIHANGDWGAWIDDGTGEFVEDAETAGDVESNRIEIEVPDDAFESDLADLELVPVLLGFDGDGPGGVREVAAEADEWTFGGGEDDDSNPNVIDLVTPAGVDNADALAYDEETGAVIPVLDVVEGIRNRFIEGEHVRTFPDGTGDDHGPGEYTYPTTEQIPDGSLDVTSVSLYEGEDEHAIVYEFDQELTDEFELSNGFSHQHLQVYVHDPDAEDGSTTAREGVTVEFKSPYQYWLFGHGEAAGLETHDGTEFGDVSVAPIEQTQEIVLSFPADAMDASLEDLEFAPLALAYDGFAPGGVRQVTEDGGEWVFGGADPEDTAPRVIDLITPSGVDNTEALAYDDTSPAAVPYVDFALEPQDYANDDGRITLDGIRGAIDDWQAGDLDTDDLVSVIDAWASGDPIH